MINPARIVPRLSLVLLGLFLPLILGGCGTAYNPLRAEVEAPNFVPEWYLEPPQEEDYLYASAKARSPNPSQAVERARRRATGQFTMVFTEAVGQLLESTADTTVRGSSRWDALLNRIESDPSSVLAMEARRVSRTGDEYVAYVLLGVPVSELDLPEETDRPEASRLRRFYERVLRDRTASRGTS